MKFILLAAILFVVVTYAMRKRNEDKVRQNSTGVERGVSLYSLDGNTITPRSADNVRLISDEQLSALEHEPNTVEH